MRSGARRTWRSRCAGSLAAVFTALLLDARALAEEPPASCRGAAVCAREHTCAELNAIVRTRGRVSVEFESGYAYNHSRGTVEFRSRCPIHMDAEPWLVIVRDGLVCELQYFCNERFPEERRRHPFGFGTIVDPFY